MESGHKGKSCLYVLIFNDAARMMCFPPYGEHGRVGGRGRCGRLYPIFLISEKYLEDLVFNSVKSWQRAVWPPLPYFFNIREEPGRPRSIQ